MSTPVRPNTPQPFLHSFPEEPKGPNDSEPPLRKIISQVWPKFMLLDIIFKTNEEMIRFMNILNESKENLNVQQLLPNAQASEIHSSCLRITSTLETMDVPLAILFETYPTVSDFLFSAIQNHKIEKK